MSRHVWLAVLGAVTFMGCTSPGDSSLSDAERRALADSIKAISAEWKSAAERADPAAILGFYVNAPETAVARADNVDQSTVAFDVFASGLPAALRSVRSQALELTDQRVSVLSRDVAAETAIGDWTETDTTGRVTRTHFAYTRVWVKRNDAWKILHSHLANAPAPAAVPPQR